MEKCGGSGSYADVRRRMSKCQIAGKHVIFMVSYIFIVTLSGRHQGPMFPPCSCCFSAIFWGL